VNSAVSTLADAIVELERLLALAEKRRWYTSRAVTISRRNAARWVWAMRELLEREAKRG
jgi:hypothetical protein